MRFALDALLRRRLACAMAQPPRWLRAAALLAALGGAVGLGGAQANAVREPAPGVAAPAVPATPGVAGSTGLPGVAPLPGLQGLPVPGLGGTPAAPVPGSPPGTPPAADVATPRSAPPAPPASSLPGGVQPVPALSDRVVDTLGLLPGAERAALVARLAEFEAQAGTQIVVLIVATTAPEDIAAYAFRVADDWKIGRREVGDGVLLLVARDDRAVRIEVARALEGAVPDLAAFRIIDGVMLPAFRQGDFAGGIDAALTQLMARIRGESLPLPEPGAGSRSAGGAGLEQLLMFFFVGVTVVSSVLTSLLGRKLGAALTAGAAGTVGGLIAQSVAIGLGVGVAALVLVGIFGLGAATRRATGTRGHLPHIGGWGGGYGSARGGWGSGGFGGGGLGGGGFSSGGGGSFGGGGASGRW